MSDFRWYLALIPAVWMAGVWVIAICRTNARTTRERSEQDHYDRLFADITAQLDLEDPT